MSLVVTNQQEMIVCGEQRQLSPGYRIKVLTDWHSPCDFIIGKPDDMDSLRFARERDCSAAINALKSHGLTTVDELKDAGWERIKQICCEAMQW